MGSGSLANHKSASAVGTTSSGLLAWRLSSQFWDAAGAAATGLGAGAAERGVAQASRALSKSTTSNSMGESSRNGRFTKPAWNLLIILTSLILSTAKPCRRTLLSERSHYKCAVEPLKQSFVTDRLRVCLVCDKSIRVVVGWCISLGLISWLIFCKKKRNITIQNLIVLRCSKIFHSESRAPASWEEPPKSLIFNESKICLI
jgi:hypothetical protein